MSYGNKWHELRFDENIFEFSLISGVSSAGKSSILNAIVYGLYGKVNNKKLSDLPNRINSSKGLEVEIEVTCNNKKVFIRRGINPNIFDVQVDNDPNVGDKAGKVSVQEYIENELFGIPFYIFTNIISLAVNDFKSFIKMGIKDKRAIIDKIFGLSIINDMYEILRADIKKLKDTDQGLEIKIQTINEHIVKADSSLTELAEIIKTKNNDRKDEIGIYLEKIKVLQQNSQTLLDELQNDKQQITDKIKIVDKQEHKQRHLISTLDEKIDLYNNSKCPICSSDLTTDFHKQLYDGYVNEKSKAEALIESLDSVRQELLNEDQRLKQELKTLNEKSKKIDLQRLQLLKELKDLQMYDNSDEQTQQLKKLITENKQDLEKTVKHKNKIEKEYNFLKIVDDVLGDKGIKSLAIKTLLPNLNLSINTMMKELNLDYRLQFDENFEPVITHFGIEISPATLSTGEAKRLDFTVLIAIIKLMKIKFPHLNLLFLDELFASVDAASVYEIIKILSDITIKMNLHTFVINHAPIDTSAFTHTIKVERNKGFSTFTKEIFE